MTDTREEIVVESAPSPVFYRFSPRGWLYPLALMILLSLIFSGSLAFLVRTWDREEYSHGYLLPLITAFLIWQKKNELARMPLVGSWWGFAVLVFGLLLYFVGESSKAYMIEAYGLVFALLGIAWAVAGGRIFREIWIPLSFLFFTIPLPGVLYADLSGKLQLLSSKLGVSLIRACDISVFLEGNVIDLGAYQLQVVDACSGLRYLFPLMSLGFICAYFFKGALWKRALIFLSSIPISVLMNSFRIGVIGVLVEYWGTSMAEGFLHDFEGWIVFMACMTILILEMWILAKIGSDSRELSEVFGVTLPPPLPVETKFTARSIPGQYWIAFALLVVALLGSLALRGREEVIPTRESFNQLTMQLGEFNGRRSTMEQKYIDSLNFDDYILADYSSPDGYAINLYAAYYSTQRADKLPHSPKGCLPAGGWQISSVDTMVLPDVQLYGSPLRVNRVVIEKGDTRQLVYYWFQQQGRNITSEYAVKWYLFWDALRSNRSDGALVRLVAPIRLGESSDNADVRLTAFAKLLIPEMDRFISK